MAMESRFTWMDGRLVPTAEAVVPFLTAGLHYGLGAFEGIRCYDTPRGPAIFRLREHVRRLLDSAKVLGLEHAFTEEQLFQAHLDVVAANDFKECYLRPLLFATTGGFNLSLRGAPVSCGVAAWEWKAYLGPEARAAGVRMNVSSFTRHHVNVSMTKAKVSGNYVNSTLAKTEAVRLGFDDAIMLDTDGYVSECTGQNIFLVRDGVLYTPGRATILEGITRDTLIILARDQGLRVVEEDLTRDQIYLSDEVFVCGSASEVVAVREVDGRKIGAGRMGPIATQLQDAYFKVIHGELPKYEAWLAFVPNQK